MVLDLAFRSVGMTHCAQTSKTPKECTIIHPFCYFKSHGGEKSLTQNLLK